MTPPKRPKPLLKAGKFLPTRQTLPPFRQADATAIDLDDKDDNDHGIYNHTVEGVGDGTHLIIASFIKTSDKIRDQLVTNFLYFSELMHANIDELNIHPLNTEKFLPILTSPTNKNNPSAGTNVRDYFLHPE